MPVYTPQHNIYLINSNKKQYHIDIQFKPKLHKRTILFLLRNHFDITKIDNIHI